MSSRASESKPGPMEVLNSTFPAPSRANSSLPSNRTFLFRQVNTTSLSASSRANGLYCIPCCSASGLRVRL